MKRVAAFFLFATLLLLPCGCGKTEEALVQLSAPPTISVPNNTPENRTVRLCVTELLGESSVLDLLRQQFESETPYHLDLLRNPDSVALSVAESGGADALLVRRGTASSRFIEAGYSSTELPFLRDTLVIAGPSSDPAGVGTAQSGTQGMLRIAQSGAGFVSRYDDSDLAAVESRLWVACGIVIGNGRSWYLPARKAMQGTLEYAAEKQAYTLSTLEGYWRSTVRGKLSLLLRDTPDLQNEYVLLLVNGDSVDHVNVSGAQTFAAFLQSAQTRTLLKDYGTDSLGGAVFEVLY